MLKRVIKNQKGETSIYRPILLMATLMIAAIAAVILVNLADEILTSDECDAESTDLAQIQSILSNDLC